MKIECLNYYNEAATLSVALKKVFNRIHLNLDFFLKFLKKDNPKSFDNIMQVLITRFQLIKKLPREIVKKNSILDSYPDLRDGVFTYILSEMKYRTHEKEGQSLTEITVTDFLRAILFYNYKIATSLTEILPRDKTIDYYKKIINERIRSQKDPNMYSEDLDEFDKQGTKFFETYQGHNEIVFRINAGKRGAKIIKCIWYEILKELNDPDFCYAVACHGDFKSTKNYNPAFVLTRTGTLMQEDEYCDFCYHDTRIIEIVEHPEEEFWNNLQK